MHDWVKILELQTKPRHLYCYTLYSTKHARV